MVQRALRAAHTASGVVETIADAVIDRQRRRLGRKARTIILDFDPTDDPTHGQQAFSFFAAAALVARVLYRVAFTMMALGKALALFFMDAYGVALHRARAR